MEVGILFSNALTIDIPFFEMPHKQLKENILSMRCSSVTLEKSVQVFTTEFICNFPLVFMHRLT
jgi:hypothetical protein